MKLLPLTKGKFAMVDDGDFDWLNKWKWCSKKDRRSRGFYAVRNVFVSKNKMKLVQMHNVIFCPDIGFVVDHRNRNTLDNQRCNLRNSSRSDNSANSPIRKNNASGFKGVYFCKRARRWIAEIKARGVRYRSRLHVSAIEAALTYDILALKHFGEFACTNKMLGLVR